MNYKKVLNLLQHLCKNAQLREICSPFETYKWKISDQFFVPSTLFLIRINSIQNKMMIWCAQWICSVYCRCIEAKMLNRIRERIIIFMDYCLWLNITDNTNYNYYNTNKYISKNMCINKYYKKRWSIERFKRNLVSISILINK